MARRKRNDNMTPIIATIEEHGPVSSQRLFELTGIERGAIHRTVSALKKKGVLKKVGRGRPSLYVLKGRIQESKSKAEAKPKRKVTTSRKPSLQSDDPFVKLAAHVMEYVDATGNPVEFETALVKIKVGHKDAGSAAHPAPPQSDNDLPFVPASS